MCLMFVNTVTTFAMQVDGAALRGEEALFKATAMASAHHDGGCRDVQLFLIYGEIDSLTVFAHIPLRSDRATMAVFPIKATDLGENAKHLVATKGALPCVAKPLDAYLNPEKFVPCPMVKRWNEPMYRSGLSCGRDEAAAARVPPQVPTRCVVNEDGSTTFVLFLANLALSPAALDAAIARGEYASRPDYLSTLGKAAFKALLGGMRSHGVVLANVFPMDDDDSEEVAAEAIVQFEDELYPSLTSDCDVICHIPAFDQKGKPKMKAASFVLHYDDVPLSVPLPGLVHNADPSDPRSTHEVEENYYVASNRKVEMTVFDTGGGVDRKIKLLSADQCLPVPSQEQPGLGLSLQDVHFPPPLASWNDVDMSDSGEVDEAKSDYAWRQACAAFQSQVRTAVFADVKAAFAKMKLGTFDASALFATNLVGRRFPKQAVSFHHAPDGSDNSVRSLRRRESAYQQKRSQAAVMGM